MPEIGESQYLTNSARGKQMKLLIEINMDNDAYAEDEARGNAELVENLMLIINKMNWGDTDGIVFYSNGNKTGYWEIDAESEEDLLNVP